MNITCLSCKYEWESRVVSPKSCPMCKRYIMRKKPVKKYLIDTKTGSINPLKTQPSVNNPEQWCTHMKKFKDCTEKHLTHSV